MLEELQHIGKGNGVRGLAAAAGGRLCGGAAVDEQVRLGGRLLPRECGCGGAVGGGGGLRGVVPWRRGAVVVGADAGRAAAGVLGEPLLVLGQVDVDADALGVVEGAGAGDELRRGRGRGLAEDGGEAGLGASAGRHGARRGRGGGAGGTGDGRGRRETDEKGRVLCPGVRVKGGEDGVEVGERADAVGGGVGAGRGHGAAGVAAGEGEGRAATLGLWL